MPTVSPSDNPSEASTALLTDHYELTMLEAALRSGAATRRCVFEVFARRLPKGRRYGVVAGVDRLLDAIAAFHFDAEELAWLADAAVVDDPTLEWLATYRFRGDVDGYPEGEVFFPGSPILSVEATFAEAVLLETVVLSVLNHDCAISSAAARMVSAAAGRPCLEMGSRRTHEEAAVAAARAAYLVGFAGTSNLQAGRRYGIPTFGTSAHAFTLIHDDERAAFRAQVESLGAQTTLLVDTFDIESAVRAAVEIAGPQLGAVRIDSGDLVGLARQVRSQLDELGARDTRIVVTSDLDEFAIAALASAPVDSYGVGTSLVTGSGAPTANLVYKLVARLDAGSDVGSDTGSDAGSEAAWRPVTKASPGKIGHGGRKRAYRTHDPGGVADGEVVVCGEAPGRAGRRTTQPPTNGARPLQVPLIRQGVAVGREPLTTARDRHVAARAALPAQALHLQPGEPALETIFLSAGRDDPMNG